MKTWKKILNYILIEEDKNKNIPKSFIAIGTKHDKIQENPISVHLTCPISSTWPCNLFVYWPSADPSSLASCYESLDRKLNFFSNRSYDAPSSVRSSSKSPDETLIETILLFHRVEFRELHSSWTRLQFYGTCRNPTVEFFYHESRPIENCSA